MRALRRRWAAGLAAALALVLGAAVFVAVARAQGVATTVHERDRAREQTMLAGLAQQYMRFSLLDLDGLATGRSWALRPGNRADRAALARFIASSPLLGAGAALTDLTGRPLTSVSAGGGLPGPADPGYAPLREALLAGRPGVSGLLPAGRRLLIAVAVPVRRGGAPVGLLLGYADVRSWPLQTYVRNLDVGPQATTSIVDGTGRVLATSRPGLLGRTLPGFVRHRGAATVGGRVVSAAPVGLAGWWSVTAQPLSGFDGAMTSAYVLVVAALAAGFALLLAALLLVARRQHAMVARLAAEAIYDPLTGVATRRLLELRLGAALARSRRTETAVAVLFVDLDGFKQVNDGRGHNAGDQLLRALSARFQGCLREDDLLARLGGDEFVAVIEGADEAAARDVAKRLVSAAADPVPIGSHPVTAGASVGVAWLGDGWGTADELLSAADMAMYDAKRAGGATYRLARLSGARDRVAPGPGVRATRPAADPGSGCRLPVDLPG
jgi:diguanylate cyclase (GGDEF)-like protein